MKKFILLILIIPSITFGEWIQFECIQGPKYDIHGRQLPSDKPTTIYSENPKKLVFGGSWICPELSGVTERYQRGKDLIVNMDIDSVTADGIISKEQEITKTGGTYKIKKDGRRIPNMPLKYNFKDFKPQRLTPKKAETILLNWGTKTVYVPDPVIPAPIVSGVTIDGIFYPY